MKSIFKAAALGMALLTFSTNLALADKGRGGGRTIDINGRRALMDLVGNKTCFWREGGDVAKETPSYAAIIETLREVHWYMASLLESEIKAVDICFTAERLPQIPVEDLLGVTVYRGDGDQTGIRFNDMVFVQEAHFKALKLGEMQKTPPRSLNQLHQLDPRHFKFMAGYFLAHEVLHSFIPYNVLRRDNSLWSMIAMIARNHLERMSPKDFALQIKRNQLEIAADITPLNPYRRAIEIALDPDANISQRTKAALAITNAFNEKQGLRNLLLEADRRTISDLSDQEIQARNQSFANALIHGSEDQVIQGYKSGGELTEKTRPASYEVGADGFRAAMERGHYRYLALLLEKEDGDYSRVDFHKGPLFLFHQGQPELALELLKKKSVLKAMSNDELLFPHLRSAIQAGWTAGVRLIMDRFLSQRDSKNSDIILFALENNRVEIAQLLMTYKYAYFHSRNAIFGKILTGERPEVLAWLQSSGIPVHWSKQDEKILLLAIRNGNLQAFRNLTKVVLPRTSYNSEEPAIETLLNLAITLNRQEIALEIFKQKNLNVRSNPLGESDSPIFRAIHEGRIELVKAAIAHPSFTMGPQEYDGPFCEAAKSNFPAAVREFLALGDVVSTYTLEQAMARSPKTAVESRRLIEAVLQVRYARAKSESDLATRRRLGQ